MTLNHILCAGLLIGLHLKHCAVRSWETWSIGQNLGVFFDICQPADACQFKLTSAYP